MREKRERKPKKLGTQDNEDLFQPKRKKINKVETNKKKDKKDTQDQQVQQNDNQNNLNGEVVNASANKQCCIQNQMKNQLEINIANQRQTFASSQSKLTNLAKLNENFQQIKAIHEENLSKYNYHKSQCEQLSQKVNQSNLSIEAKAKQLRNLSKTIYLDSVRNSKEQFLNPNTFRDANRLETYVKNLVSIVENLQNCPYEDPLENIKFTRINPESFLAQRQITIGKHKKEKVIKDHLGVFPYMTVGAELFQVIQALLNSTKYVEKQQGSAIQQFPCLFVRYSGLSFSVKQTILNVFYKLISDTKNKLVKNIQNIVNHSCSQGSDTPPQTISELIYKGMAQTKFICFPQIQFQIRGFSFGGSIFINTYYIEKDESIGKDVLISYCVLTLIRELANFVVNSLTYCLNKNDEDIGKSISDIRQRTDAGAKLEHILTNGRGFVCASTEDYKNLISHDIRLEDLGQNNSQYGTSYVFEEQRKRKDVLTSSLLSKYDTRKSNDTKKLSKQNPNVKKLNQEEDELDSVEEQVQQNKQIPINEKDFGGGGFNLTKNS